MMYRTWLLVLQISYILCNQTTKIRIARKRYDSFILQNLCPFRIYVFEFCCAEYFNDTEKLREHYWYDKYIAQLEQLRPLNFTTGNTTGQNISYRWTAVVSDANRTFITKTYAKTVYDPAESGYITLVNFDLDNEFMQVLPPIYNITTVPLVTKNYTIDNSTNEILVKNLAEFKNDMKDLMEE